MRALLFVAIAVATMMGPAHEAAATLINYHVTGTVKEVAGPISSVTVGMDYDAYFTVDDSATLIFDTPNIVLGNAITSVSIDIGSGAYVYAGSISSVTSSTLFITGGTSGTHQYIVTGDPSGAPALDGLVPDVFDIVKLADSTGTALPVASITPVFPALSAFDPYSGIGSFAALAFGGGSVGVELISVPTVVPIPEPATSVLLLFGMIGMASVRRRRSG